MKVSQAKIAIYERHVGSGYSKSHSWLRLVPVTPVLCFILVKCFIIM